MRRSIVVFLTLLAAPVLGLAACNAVLARQEASHAETVRKLHEEARALIPPSAQIVAEEEGACVLLRSAPSCVSVTLDWAGSYDMRRETLEARARARGWTPASNRPSFVFTRGGFEAGLYVRLRQSGWKRLCAGRSAAELDRYDRDSCLDQVSVRVR